MLTRASAIHASRADNSQRIISPEQVRDLQQHHGISTDLAFARS